VAEPPEHIKAALDRARNDPNAYRELKYDDFSRRPGKRSAPGEPTHAWSPSSSLPTKPAAMFALGAKDRDELRALVKSPRLLQAAVGWVSGSLVLCGPTGAGKTAALVLLCIERNPKGWRWVDGYTLGTSAQRHSLGEGEPELIAMACRARVLIVDDPDHAKDREPFIEVMRHRYRHQMPTLVATGKSYTELEAHFGDAYVRRIEESGATCKVVDLWDEK
jgi:DNA replication protein DnaC